VSTRATVGPRIRVDFTASGKPVTHGGTGTGYAHHGCRCDDCTDANTERVARRAAERRGESPPPESHGKAATYRNWGCRCDRCSAAAAADRQASRAT
jgi:hypothetical protein